ncbi:MAG: BBE domain-containing protein [Verrucomicrobia bacterium]|nr:BBE domain-containing protein [Verrucomicrobiota bacterium]
MTVSSGLKNIIPVRCSMSNVQRLSIRLYRVGQVLSGSIVFLWGDAPAVLARISRLMQAAGRALPGGYANLLYDDAREQIGSAFGPNGPRLLELKKRFDPSNILSAIPLPGR